MHNTNYLINSKFLQNFGISKTPSSSQNLLRELRALPLQVLIMSSEMDIVLNTKNNGLNVESRRESIDSGVGVSPSPSPSPASVDSVGRSRRNKKKKRQFSTMSASSFSDLYSLKNDILGQGSYGRVESCVNVYTQMEYAVKIINKDSWAFNRQKMLKEIW